MKTFDKHFKNKVSLINETKENFIKILLSVHLQEEQMGSHQQASRLPNTGLQGPPRSCEGAQCS